MNARSIVSAATQLPEAERVRVIEDLLESLDPTPVDDPQEVADAWREELARRSDELRTGKVKPIPWSDVRVEGERLLDGQN
jgi:putative addiction module component (TIGR02574 family)